MNAKTDWTKVSLKVCEFCKSAFQHRYREKLAAYKRRRFCSNKCKLKSLAQSNSGKKAHNNRQVERSCIQCHKKRMVAPCRSDRKFCSRKCMGIWMKEHCTGEDSNRWNGGQVKRTCLTCQKQFYVDKHVIEREGRGQFCSQSCTGIFYSQKEKNPNWKGGITPELRALRNKKESKEWKLFVLARDQNICQKCNSRKNLHAHHIKPFANNPTKRFDRSNGITLCQDCHYGLHYKNYRVQREDPEDRKTAKWEV